MVFKTDYRTFKGEISLLINFSDGDEEEFSIFNQEIKAGGLIYTEEGWAVYDSRLVEIDKVPSSLAIKISAEAL